MLTVAVLSAIYIHKAMSMLERVVAHTLGCLPMHLKNFVVSAYYIISCFAVAVVLTVVWISLTILLDYREQAGLVYQPHSCPATAEPFRWATDDSLLFLF